MSQYRYKPSGQIKIYSRIVRGSLALPEDQRLVLLFVLDRSIERGNSLATISLKEFEGGIIRKKAGKRVTVVPGTKLPPERLIAAIDALRDAGAITISRREANIFCSINEDWLHPVLPRTGPYALWGVNERDYLYPNGEAKN